MRKLFFLVALLFSASAFAVDESENICTAGGYYDGANEDFLVNLALHILSQRKVLGTLKCNALWDEGRDVGKRLSGTGQLSRDTDKENRSLTSSFFSGSGAAFFVLLLVSLARRAN